MVRDRIRNSADVSSNPVRKEIPELRRLLCIKKDNLCEHCPQFSISEPLMLSVVLDQRVPLYFGQILLF